MHILNVSLKQHTPLIHFQHDQEGATLRASEVKPRLDKYILGKLGKENCNSFSADNLKSLPIQQQYYEIGRLTAKQNGWLVGKGDQPALNYKMRIKTEGKKYEHKIRIINADKYAVYYNKISITLLFKDSLLSELLKKNIANFFIEFNFGFRQSKGYGSFTVLPDESEACIQKKDYETVLTDVYEKVGKIPIRQESTIPFNLSRFIRVKPKSDDNDIVKEKINHLKNLIIPISKVDFNEELCFKDYRDVIKKELENKIEEVNNCSDSNFTPYKAPMKEGLNQCIINIDEVHNYFLYSYFKKVLDTIILSKFQVYKSGRNKPYEKSHLRDFYGELKKYDKVVYWDKRFMKQKLDQLRTSGIDIPALRDNHKNDPSGKSELKKKDDKDTTYFFIRAILGLEGHFEFQTEEKEKKIIISVENKDIERFQSIITFKVIADNIYVCIKSKNELKEILNQGFLFKVYVKNEKRNLSFICPLDREITVPDLKEDEIDSLYQDIITYFCN